MIYKTFAKNTLE